ncbi:LytTr DNA-binding domain-containing protein [Mariniflexile fucanivorans]|uniref:LytTr DNA-binding domain-containing protein n=1 Tax=Mariniflexile fucanivorans TaxID=264023 RepID=A0A4R1RRJ6_9FLAO|nr:LytTR family DNA-binding domain-containing protein [Mariniflexile fucanivorans]TCL69053.1 LytTr DNA-binding domain-containing protein [Mariniflexile fucanivorans]
MLAILLQNSIPNFWNAWLIALFFLPIAFFIKYGIQKTKLLKGFKKWNRYFFIAIISLFWGYVAIVLAYWYFLELKANSIESTLVNPIFIWIIIGFFILLEQAVFKKNKQIDKETITIFSDRKKTIITIANLAYIESRGDFTLAVLLDGSQYKNTIRITEWELKLDTFIRIHRSFLVNPNEATLNGNEIIINKAWNLPISRSYKQQVMAYFK